jgi:hypothetical protein
LITNSKIGTIRQSDPQTAEKFPATLIIESGFSFPDDFLNDANKNLYNLTPKGEGSAESPSHKEIESILDHAGTRGFIREISARRFTTTPIVPDWIRLRYSRETSVDNSDRKFTLGVLVKVPFLIDLKPIEKAGTETLEDLCTYFFRNFDYNDNDTSISQGQSESVPPVTLLTQA